MDDVANAIFYFMQNRTDPEVLNIGYGSDITIRVLTEKIATVADFEGKLSWEVSKPDGMYRKLMDCFKAQSLGWKPQTSLDEGARTVAEYPKISQK